MVMVMVMVSLSLSLSLSRDPSIGVGSRDPYVAPAGETNCRTSLGTTDTEVRGSAITFDDSSHRRRGVSLDGHLKALHKASRRAHNSVLLVLLRSVLGGGGTAELRVVSSSFESRRNGHDRIYRGASSQARDNPSRHTPTRPGEGSTPSSSSSSSSSKTSHSL